MARVDATSTTRLRRQLPPKVTATTSVQNASSSVEPHCGWRFGAPSVTVSLASAWTTMPGSEPYTGTASTSPSSSAVAPTNTGLPVNTSCGTRPSSTST